MLMIMFCLQKQTQESWFKFRYMCGVSHAVGFIKDIVAFQES